MEGSYLAMKIDYLITFFILAPIWRLVAKLLSLVRADFVCMTWLQTSSPSSYQGHLLRGRQNI